MNSKSIKEIIPARYSVRNYSGEPLSEEMIEKINSYIKNLKSPFNKEVRIQLVKRNTDGESIKLGTYGVIKGADYFLISACENDDESLMALGYALEEVILYCTSLGLGTVWLGGTFKKSDFAKAIDLKSDEILPIVAPVGYGGGKKSLLGTLFGNHKNVRKPFSKLFFNGTFDTPLTESDAKEYFEPLEMLRLAPSAVNKQPWRAVKENNNINFYLVSTNNLNKVDIGIGLCHFHLTAIENKLEGQFKVIDDKKESAGFTYVISWVK
ncbi:MAG: nitroreductase family protein [Clostridium sp.]|nr:nitroreductase family protein [Clostridium sp.]